MSSRFALACLATAVLLVAGACRGASDEVEPSPTADATATPVAAEADFQLVGTIDEAFAGPQPDIDITDRPGDEAQPDLDDPDPASPQATAATAATPAASPTPAATLIGEEPEEGGIMRIVVDDVSASLSEECDIERDDEVIVYWTTGTFFTPSSVLDDIEDSIEEETTGISGTIYTDDGECVLVAEQVGFTNVLPTPRPRATTTSAPARRSTPTPTATATEAPTATPKATTKPSPTVTATSAPSPTATP